MTFWLSACGIGEVVFLAGFDLIGSNERYDLGHIVTNSIWPVSLALFAAAWLYPIGKRSQVLIDENRIIWRIPPMPSRSIAWSQINRVHVKRKLDGEIRLIRLDGARRTRTNLFYFVDMPVLLSTIREQCGRGVRFTQAKGIDPNSHVSLAAVALVFLVLFNGAFFGIVYF